MSSLVVIGGGVAGMVAARSAALRGADVTLIEATDRLGGAVAGEEVGGVRVDTGADSIAARGEAALGLFAALGLEPLAPADAGAWLETPAGAFPLPAAGVLGIPGSPLAADVRAVIGDRAAWRAWLDRILPVLTIGREHNLGELVRRRMGPVVLETLVTPVVRNVYAVDPDNADVEALASGLNGALTRTGSLSSAVLQLRAAMPAGSAVRGLPGGMSTLVAALERDLQRFGVRVLRSTPATSLLGEAGVWEVATGGATLGAERVILACSGESARTLLEPLLPGLTEDWPAAHRTTVVTLVVDAPALDAAPRGSGVLVADGVPDVRAGALTHTSAKWPWLAAELPKGRHVLRLSYRGDVGDQVGTAEAVADAERLLGCDRGALLLVDSAVTPWTQESQRALIGMRARVDRLRSAIAEMPGLDVAGAWVAGTGLAAVVADGGRAGQSV